MTKTTKKYLFFRIRIHTYTCGYVNIQHYVYISYDIRSLSRSFHSTELQEKIICHHFNSQSALIQFSRKKKNGFSGELLIIQLCIEFSVGENGNKDELLFYCLISFPTHFRICSLFIFFSYFNAFKYENSGDNIFGHFIALNLYSTGL